MKYLFKGKFPKIHIFDPRTPKFGILVHNGETIQKFLEFLKNVEKCFARHRVCESLITLKLVSKIYFFVFFSEYAKISKIWFM